MMARETSEVLLTMNAWFTGTCVVLVLDAMATARHHPYQARPERGPGWWPFPDRSPRSRSANRGTNRFQRVKGSEVAAGEVQLGAPVQFKGGRMATPVHPETGDVDGIDRQADT